MLILQIALGIVLAVVILRFWEEILSLGVWLLIGMAVLVLAGSAIAYASSIPLMQTSLRVACGVTALVFVYKFYIHSFIVGIEHETTLNRIEAAFLVLFLFGILGTAFWSFGFLGAFNMSRQLLVAWCLSCAGTLLGFIGFIKIHIAKRNNLYAAQEAEVVFNKDIRRLKGAILAWFAVCSILFITA